MTYTIDKPTLSYLKGEAVRVLMDFNIPIAKHEAKILLQVCELIDKMLLEKVASKKILLQEITYIRFIEWELILKTSKTRDVKKISIDLKKALTKG